MPLLTRGRAQRCILPWRRPPHCRAAKVDQDDRKAQRTVTTRADRIAQFVVDRNASEGTLAKLLCEDHVGTYTLPFPCRRSAGAWLNARPGEPIHGRRDRRARVGDEPMTLPDTITLARSGAISGILYVLTTIVSRMSLT
jgi:hypothetical protein